LCVLCLLCVSTETYVAVQTTLKDGQRLLVTPGHHLVTVDQPNLAARERKREKERERERKREKRERREREERDRERMERMERKISPERSSAVGGRVQSPQERGGAPGYGEGERERKRERERERKRERERERGRELHEKPRRKEMHTLKPPMVTTLV
jgi:hypothetical protein